MFKPKAQNVQELESELSRVAKKYSKLISKEERLISWFIKQVSKYKNKAIYCHKIVSMEKKEAIITAPNTDKYPVIGSVSEELCAIATQANWGLYTGNNQMAVTAMNQLFDSCYGQNGHRLLNISHENCQPVGLAFAKLAILFSFNNIGLNSVAAENAFYCLARNFIAKGNTFVTPALFTMLLKHEELLKDKLISTHCSMIEKSLRIKIGMLLNGNPSKAPHLADFREEAVSKRIDIMAYLIQFIYDFDESKYKIPTDMPYLIPNSSDIELFRTLVSDSGSSVKEMQPEGQKYFYAMFENCENTLSHF